MGTPRTGTSSSCGLRCAPCIRSGSRSRSWRKRRVVLSVLDRKWREHLYEMDYLQEGIGLRAMGQRDPLVEYQREGFTMFATMMEAIKEESVGFLFNVEVNIEPVPAEASGLEVTAADAAADGGGPVAPPLEQVRPAEDSVPDAATLTGVEPHGVAGESVPSQAPAAFTAEPGGQPAAARGQVGVLPKGLGAIRPRQNLQYTAPSVDGEETVTRSAGPGTTNAGPGTTNETAGGEPASGQVVGSQTARNAPCPCGSGRKFKRCHGAPGAR